MINKFETCNLRAAIYGSITAAVVALPLALLFPESDAKTLFLNLIIAVGLGMSITAFILCSVWQTCH